MAIEKVFRDDVTGEIVAKENVRVIRVGWLSDRPEACHRLEIGPGAYEFPISNLIELADARQAELGTTGEEHDVGDDQAPA